ncbi:MAG TPA: radical SAM protein [Anaerolineales bacterium]
MLDRIHILLTYSCPLRCKHCFVFGDPQAKGTFTTAQITRLLSQIQELGSIKWIFFEGGEPFYHYPLLLQGLRRACEKGFSVGVITNGYFARSEQTAARFLRPLKDMGVAKLCVSDDPLHYRSTQDSPAKRTLRAAFQLGLPAGRVCVESSTLDQSLDPGRMGPEMRTRFNLKWRGRAAGKLAPLLPFEAWGTFTRCPNQDLADPHRLDIDAYGNVQICQGISIGNAWETPLSTLLEDYHADVHPILAPLHRGGPAALAEAHRFDPTETYAEPCHLCYATRQSLIDRFPEYLAPRQVYGL